MSAQRKPSSPEPPMTPAELRAAMANLGLTQEAFAKCIHINTRHFERMLAGTRKILPRTAMAVNLLVERERKIDAENCK